MQQDQVRQITLALRELALVILGHRDRKSCTWLLVKHHIHIGGAVARLRV